MSSGRQSGRREPRGSQPTNQPTNHKTHPKMDHRSVSAAAAGGAIAIGPSPAPHRMRMRSEGQQPNTSSSHILVIQSVAVPTTISEKQQNILRFNTKLTPWAGVAEFDAVGRGLLLATALFPPPQSSHRSTDQQEQQQQDQQQHMTMHCCPCPLSPDERSELDYALWSVAVWRDRAEGGRLPHAVETSAALASVLLEDAAAHGVDGGVGSSADCCYSYPQHGHGHGHCRPPSELSLRMSYASAVIRATNGLADASVANRGLKKPGYGVSVAALCERIGIPGWVVDMRHDAAHNDLPSLPSLRLASKTLLGYLGDKYWSELGRLRGEAATKAVGTLDAYKASAKAAAVEHAAKMNQQIAKAEAAARARASRMKEKREQERAGKKNKKQQQKQQEEDGSDDDDGDDDYMEFGRFSIFADTSSSSSTKKKKGKKRPREESGVDAEGAENDDAKLSTSKDQDANKEDEPGPTTKASTNDSDKGTTDDANSKPKKQKLPSPLKLASQFIEEVTIDTGLQILLLYLVWGGVGDMPPEKGALVPGSPATIPETEQGFDKVKNRYVLLLAKVSTAYTGFLHALVVNLVDLILLIEERQAASDEVVLDAGEQRKLFFLGRWVKYLVSREFHSHFDPHLGVFSRGKIDLTRKRVWKWTEAEKSFMADCAPYEALHRWQFPLSSLYQRCTGSVSAGGDGKVTELISLFKKAGGDHILDDNTEDADAAKTHSDVKNQPASSEQKLEPAEEKLTKGGGSGMSLEQMEALLSDSDAEDDNDNKSKPEGDTHTSNINDDGDAFKNPSNSEVTAWSQCKSWEPCAIGTLPGYPTFY